MDFEDINIDILCPYGIKIAREEDEFNGMNETELREYQMWTMEDLQDHLIETVRSIFY